MSWLFWILLVLFALSVIQGARRGLVRTAVSMVFFILVIVAVSWLNPYVSDFIRQKTNWQEQIQGKTESLLAEGLWEEAPEGQEDTGAQEEFIRELPLPDGMKDMLIENNTLEGYQTLAAESFAEYLSGYIAYGIVNGIAFIISFVIAIVLIRLILYAVDLLTELPVISGINRLGGAVLGAVQGLLWLWIIFLVITLLYDTAVGGILMDQIHGDPVLNWLYDRNYLMNIIMRMFSLGG